MLNAVRTRCRRPLNDSQMVGKIPNRETTGRCHVLTDCKSTPSGNSALPQSSAPPQFSIRVHPSPSSMVHTLSVAVTAAAVLTSAVAAADFDFATSFSSKTAYWDQSKDPLARHATVKPSDAAKFSLVQVQQVVRHGSRFPTSGNIEDITELVSRLQSNYSSVLPQWLRSYQVPYNESVEGLLAPAGDAELQAFGKRARQSVGQALPGAFSSDKFIVQHTYKPRTKSTAQNFVSTFFANAQNVTYIEYTKKNDPLLRFYDQCARYIRDVKDSANGTIEVAKYQQTDGYQKNIETLRKALNLPATANLTTKDVESAFSACAFDLALYKTKDNWCSLLTEDYIKSAEYAEELESFYESGPGHKINYEISAVLLQDVFKFMKDFADKKTQIVGNFRFSHAETTLPLMTLLGYADKTPLLASSSAEDIEHRKFRASRLAPFMANVEFRLYKKKATDCASQPVSHEGGYFVQIRINEQATYVPGCDGEVFCPLSKVEEIWKYYLTKYDFDADCKI